MPPGGLPEESQSWRNMLHHVLIHEMSPDAFERLTKRILRESEFVQVEVTGRSGEEIKQLRLHLIRECLENNVLGNREFSIPRIKLVATAFMHALGRAILIKNDKMLYATKYFWYADMFAKKELGKSMTGATYAHLPLGPQLNNYRDLLDEISDADISKAEGLSVLELDIIQRIAKLFPEDQMAFEASHKEPAWLETNNGELISYTWADRLNVTIN